MVEGDAWFFNLSLASVVLVALCVRFYRGVKWCVFDPRMFLMVLLMLCGDVERNPGPMLCGVCGGRCNGRGPQCEVCECWVHLKCSGMTRTRFYSMKSMKDECWSYASCRGGVTDGAVVVVDEMVVNDVDVVCDGSVDCMKCGVKLRSGNSGVRCVGCSGRVHKKCCSLSRNQLERGEVWSCDR